MNIYTEEKQNGNSFTCTRNHFNRNRGVQCRKSRMDRSNLRDYRHYHGDSGEKDSGAGGNGAGRICLFDRWNNPLPSYVHCMYCMYKLCRSAAIV